ncbi:MAG: helix-turn-helix domain-containing protein [Myxococcales bacterium]|nr:helix-turn-helix domain-containing protein [Myxococcales bacterium]
MVDPRRAARAGASRALTCPAPRPPSVSRLSRTTWDAGRSSSRYSESETTEEADMIRCSNCEKGKFRRRIVESHDVSPLLGLDQVMLLKTPALVCDHCGTVTVEGEVLESVMASLARLIVEQGEELRPKEVRYLRETLDLTQAELAERLGLKRLTVVRWESGAVGIGRAQSLALRSLVAWHLDDPRLARQIASLAPRLGPRTIPPYRIKRMAS